MEGFDALGVGGAIGVLVLGLVLWKLFKLALKVVLLLVAAAGIALVVALAVDHERGGLPIFPIPEPAPADIGHGAVPTPHRGPP